MNKKLGIVIAVICVIITATSIIGIVVANQGRVEINAEYDMTADEAIAYENRAFGQCFATADQKGGMRAFLDKSKYEFQGK